MQRRFVKVSHLPPLEQVHVVELVQLDGELDGRLQVSHVVLLKYSDIKYHFPHGLAALALRFSLSPSQKESGAIYPSVEMLIFTTLPTQRRWIRFFFLSSTDFTGFFSGCCCLPGSAFSNKAHEINLQRFSFHLSPPPKMKFYIPAFVEMFVDLSVYLLSLFRRWDFFSPVCGFWFPLVHTLCISSISP